MNYQELDSKRLKVYSAYKRDMIIGVLLCIVIIGIFFIIKAQMEKNNFLKEFKKSFVNELLNDLYPGSEYNPSLGIPIGTIMSVGMVKSPDRYHTEDLMVGNYKDVKFSVADCHLEERHETRDANGHHHTEYETYFKGRWFIFEYEKNFNQIIKVKEKQVFDGGMNKRGLVKCEVESIDFCDKFNVYASDEQHLFVVLTPVMIDAMLRLEKMYKGRIMFAFINNQLHIGINDNKDYLEPKISQPITEEMVKKFSSQIDIIGAIINEFELSTYKFKNEEIA